MKCLLDMDGVLVDFVDGVCRAHKRDNPYHNPQYRGEGTWDIPELWGMDTETFFAPCDYSFWTSLKKMPEADEIVSLCIDRFGIDNVCILSHPNGHAAVDGKLAWLESNYPELLTHTLFGPAKHFCSHPDNLLVDDGEHNIRAFQEHGGRAWLVPRPWNSRHALEPNLIEELSRFLDEKETENPKDVIGARKVPYSTVPAGVISEIAVGMLEGALKYGRHNYRQSRIRYSIYYDAALRHLMDWWEGEDIDPDSGLNHIAKTLCCLTVLRDAMHGDMVIDDRPPTTKDGWMAEFNERVKEVMERYPDPKPPHTRVKDTPSRIA